MRFQVLGPVEIRAFEAHVPLRGTKLRTVLATLLLSRGGVVSDDTLSLRLWGERPPVTAGAQIQTYVSRLRQAIGGQATITRHRPDGYALRIETAQFDLAEFDSLTAAGRAALASGRFEEAAATLREALGLWVGPALGGVTSHLTELVRPGLEEIQLGVVEDRVEADLALGRNAEVVTQLAGLVAAHPLRERPHAQLMLAHARSGRQAEALRIYQRCRRTLVEELGVDPGSVLRQAHAAVLAGGTATSAPPRPTPTPAELAAAPADFTGREKQVARACSITVADRAEPGTRPVCSIAGMAGVGKTALALHVAHRVRSSFPDGQLWVDLHGTAGRPVAPAAALEGMVASLLGHQPRDPEDGGELGRRYRSLLTGRRVLIVLDDAVDERQVRPLLPGTGDCGVLITSRNRLAALEGVQAVELDVPEDDEALSLFLRIIGRERGAAEPLAAERIVELCGRLPLAVRIAAAKLVARPQWTLTRLAARLAPELRRLGELSTGDLDVRSRLEPTYRLLAPPVRRVLLLLGTVEETELTLRGAAAVIDSSPAATRDFVEQLVDARLLEFTGRHHFRFQPLVRAFAREQAAAEETAVDPVHGAARASA